MRRCLRAVALSGALVARAQAQVTSVTTTIPAISGIATWNPGITSAAAAAAANTLSITINSGAVQDLPSLLDKRLNNFATPVSITTQWSLTSLVSVIDLVGYFSSPVAALVNGSASIPSSRIEGRMKTGQANTFAPFSGGPVAATGTAGGTLHLFRQPVVLPTSGQGQRTDNLELQINLQQSPVIASGVYRGTLTLRAIAY